MKQYMMKKIHQKLKMIHQKNSVYEIESHLLNGEQNKQENKLLITNFEVKVENRKVEGLITYSTDQQIFKFKAPTLSTCTVIGNSTAMFMVCNSCTMNFNSFTTSESAMYSASVVDSTTLFIPLLLQAIGIPQKYITYPNILILVSLSLAKSLSLSAFSTHFLMLLISLNFSPQYVVDSTNLMSLYISFKCAGAGASIVFDSSLTGLQMSGLLCLVR